MKKIVFGTLGLCMVLALANMASAQTARFEGHWKNVNPQTRGVVELDIRVHGLDVDVKAWGACTPHPCEIGNIDAHLYAPSVDSNLEATARALIVNYHDSFSNRTLVIEPRGEGELSAQMFTHFTDHSKRTNYVESGTFSRTR
jgi:hypothetical protein